MEGRILVVLMYSITCLATVKYLADVAYKGLELHEKAQIIRENPEFLDTDLCLKKDKETK